MKLEIVYILETQHYYVYNAQYILHNTWFPSRKNELHFNNAKFLLANSIYTREILVFANCKFR